MAYGQGKHTSCRAVRRRVVRAAGVLLFVMLFSHLVCHAQNYPLLMSASGKMLNSGIVINVAGRPGFVRYSEPVETGDTVTVRALGLNRDVTITVDDDPVERERVVILPIEIEDKSLAKGVNLQLITPTGKATTVHIPPRRVFISIPFTIPLTEAVDPDFALTNRHMIIQVIPRITKKAQVDISNTATDGLVADIKYEGLAYLKFKDLMDDTNRRDLDGTFFFGTDQNERWELITENLFEKFDERTVGVMKNHRVSQDLQTQWRLDQIDNKHEMHFGLNLIHDKDTLYAKVGNIDRIVKSKMHTELGYGDEDLRMLTRFEGLEIRNPSGHSPLAMNVDRFGYQLQFSGGTDKWEYAGLLGNLKVQDFNDYGEIDDYFNSHVMLSTYFGSRKRGKAWSSNKFNYAGETTMHLWGLGDTSWLEGTLDFNFTYGHEYLVAFRLNNDFMRLTGDPTLPLWEDFLVSFNRNRNYFNPKDMIGKFGLDSIFLDFQYSREGKGERYGRTVQFGVSKFLRVWKYDLPVEFYLEQQENDNFRFGASISIRRYF